MADYAAALDRIEEYLAAQRGALGLPGVACVATDRERTLRTVALGSADLATGAPLTAASRFQIGSASKSFTSVALLRASESGLIDLAAPVTRYLPWFAVRSPHAPITIHHLLNHTAGLFAGRDVCPDPHFEIWALRDAAIEMAPGEHFHYSNVGYKILGLVLEAVYRQPFAAIIREQVLDPLGMAETNPIITPDLRGRIVQGHLPARDDRPRRRDEPLAAAPWIEFYTADGSAVASPADLATYLRFLLNRGAGPAGLLLSPASFDAMTTPLVAMTPARTWHYGYGFIVRDQAGHREIGHNGEMVGQYTTLLADLDAGLGVMVMINGPGETLPLADFALRTLRAAHEGRALPPLPADLDPLVVPNAADYAGTYRGEAGDVIAAAGGDGLVLHHRGKALRLERRGRDTFLVPHPDFARFLLRFGRVEGRVVEAFHGPDWFRHDRDDDPATFALPEGWAACCGHYRSPIAGSADFHIVPRKGALVLIQTQGRELALRPLDEPLTFRVGPDPHSPERLRFDAVLEGAALRASLAGNPYYRIGASAAAGV